MTCTTNPQPAAISVRVSSARSRLGPLFALALCAFASLASFAASPTAAVVDSEQFAQFSSHGSGAGQTDAIFGMASDPSTGHVYVADLGNLRVDVFTPWGDFVKAWGWGVDDGKEELETCTEETGCVPGLPGMGKGQFAVSPDQIAVDGNGNVYVLDGFGNHRVQEFDSAGQFVLMFGAKVNKTTGGNVCTAASGDECQAGSTGTGPGELGEGAGLAIGQSGTTILVGAEGRIEEFEADGSFKGEFNVSGIVDRIAVDPTGSSIYAMLRGKDDVRKLSSTGTDQGSLKVHEPLGIATDPFGNVYVAHGTVEEPSENQGPDEVTEFTSGGAEASHCCIQPLEPGQLGGATYTLTGLATNTAGDLYAASRATGSNYITAYGPGPIKFGPPPKVPPAILAQYAVSVDSTSATLKAQINPQFWGDTRFYLEYGPEPCATIPCTRFPAPPGSELGAGGVRKPVTSSGVVLTGLSPHTTYHYRFVAQSGGGGPVYGPEQAFTTFPAAHPLESCSNEAFRTGASAALPDCRAYELVSPLDKNNGDITTVGDINRFETRLDQAATDGESFTYSSYRAFGGSEGGPWTAQYLARRGREGWQSESLASPVTGTFYGSSQSEDEFKAFSPDLCRSWLVPGGESDLASGQVAGFPNLYRRDNCPKSYEALTTVKPPGVLPSDYIPEPQGYSADGGKAIFRVNGKLTESATASSYQLYEASDGALADVCVFPEDIGPAIEAEFPACSAGSPPDSEGSAINRAAMVSHALSADGSRIYWSASATPLVPGKIYLRLDGTTTLPVSEAEGAGQTTKPARFWGAAVDGSKALYVVEDPNQKNPTPKDKGLYLYSLGAGETTLIAPKVTAVVATSEDLSRIYFVSTEALAGTSGATSGRANLYLDEEGAMAFIATLSATDLQQVPSDGSPRPVYHAAAATPDGARLAFISTEALTGADNSDLQSGEADSEVFTYDAESRELSCASCSPAGVRPAGRAVEAGGQGHSLWTAASLPTPQTELNAPRALSEDGSKLFFTSYADLLPADTNGKADVYEWEAVGSGSCKDESDPDYYPATKGCLFLISSGESPSDSQLLDTAADGRDVFFTTNASLLPQDPGQVDVYDARSGGGFPQSTQAVACEGEACQGPIVPPNDTTPASFVFSGPGNLTPPPILVTPKAKVKPKAKPCGKHTVRKKGKCVRKGRSARKGSAKHGKAGKSSRGIVKHNRRASR